QDRDAEDPNARTPERLNADKPRDECGVFGVYEPGDDVARLTYFGLFALQHRGQESAGIALSDGGGLRCHNELGLVPEVFEVVVLTLDEVLAFRDPNGVRPLCLGKLNGHGWIVASETCALNPIGASFVREIEPGELVVLDREGCTPTKGAPADRPSMCVFEFI